MTQLPLILSPGEWETCRQVIDRIARTAETSPGSPVYLIAGPVVIAQLDEPLLTHLVLAARELEATSPLIPRRQIIARTLRDRRRRLGISQEHVAELCGWARQAYGSIERGERDVQPPDIDILARVLDLDELRTL